MKAWPDIFTHLSYIGQFSRAQGFGQLSDISMHGGLMHPYHFASYMLPATLAGIQGNTLIAYTALLMPMGFWALGLGAYSIVNAVFSNRSAALLAGIAVLTIPDAFQLGIGNQLAGGYFWLLAISPGLLYGSACGAVSLTFFFISNATGGNKKLYGICIIFLLLAVFFKAQIFFILGIIIIVLTIYYYETKALNKIVLLIMLLLACYSTKYEILNYSFIPTIKYDGSGFESYSHLIISNQNNLYINNLYNFFASNSLSKLLYILLMTFSIYIPLYILSLFLIRRKYYEFPLLLIIIYIFNLCFLALDDRKIGSPEELIHRPWVFIQYILIAWLAFYVINFIKKNLPEKHNNLISMGLIIILTIFPLINSKNIHQYSKWNVLNIQIPKCSFYASSYLRLHTNQEDLILDLNYDKGFIISGLSNREFFIIDSGGSGYRRPKGWTLRSEEIEKLKFFNNENEIKIYLNKNNIRYILSSNMNKNYGRLLLHCEDKFLYEVNNK